ncbi:hypothetical protein HPB52_019584 [Rhipicephalus sanguineus]|uniref:lactoylglutathione lyase n=1 Tax=Rhipicephalus sanguineus TaxID=34632 RepID=A0A9D4T480_RHISA|nr:hypothetical protein HPB52_019584 [Rhipicephalus sanguineus]
MSGCLSDQEAEKCCSEPDPSTRGFIMQQTMYRIRDPKASLDFYTRVLGMRLLQKLDFPEMKFSLYFVGFEESVPKTNSPQERAEWAFGRKATIELTHLQQLGGSSRRAAITMGTLLLEDSVSHIGIMVPDVAEACARFEKLGVKFVKKPHEGKMKNIAFIQDPDGYWIEILNNKSVIKDVFKE